MYMVLVMYRYMYASTYETSEMTPLRNIWFGSRVTMYCSPVPSPYVDHISMLTGVTVRGVYARMLQLIMECNVIFELKL